MNICMRCGKQLPSPAMTKQDCSHLGENRKCIIFAYSRSQCLSIIQSEFYYISGRYSNMNNPDCECEKQPVTLTESSIIKK